MSTFESSLKSALATTERQVLITTILSAPDMSLADLAKEAKGAAGKLFGSITIGDLLNASGHTDATPASVETPRRSRKKSGRATTLKQDAIDTRSLEGRTAYDEALLQAVKAGNGGGLGSNEIREAAGGTPRQASAGLNRLIGAGRISWGGKARGTKYYIA